MTTTRAGSPIGSLRTSTASTTVKIAVVAAMPNASVSGAMIVYPGLLISIRAPYRTSCQSAISFSLSYSRRRVQVPPRLLVTQCHQRIDFRRAPTRHITSHKCHGRQQDRYTYERCGIGWGDAEDHSLHQTRQTERGDQAQSNANQDEHHAASNHQS